MNKEVGSIMIEICAIKAQIESLKNRERITREKLYKKLNLGELLANNKNKGYRNV